MSGKMMRWAYEQLIEEDIAALPESMPKLEREHIIEVLRNSVTQHYGEARCGDVSENSLYSCNKTKGHTGDHMEGLAVWSRRGSDGN